jgi:DNA polymerase (family 10)
MSEDRMTERIIKAIRNKHVKILGHPSGRLLLSREPYSINMNAVIKAAAEEKVILEINANPLRLDLDWRFCKTAKEAGCKFVISPDAHRTDGIDDMQYGVNVARKGWLTKEDVINVYDCNTVIKLLNR